MQELLVAVVVLGVLLYLFWRANRTGTGVKVLDTRGLTRRSREEGSKLIRSKLQRIQDPRLAATILMLQLVRTGPLVTAAEKTQITDFMEDPLQIRDVASFFGKAWNFTEQNRAFSPIADELVPLLRKKLTPDERSKLIAMLRSVANAYKDASELQIEAINRLKRHLMMPDHGSIEPHERRMGDP